jgi:manganese efflux pump family protein
MPFLTDFLLALGLSMDAFAVSMSSSTTIRPFRVNDALKLAFFSGAFRLSCLYWAGLGGTQ